MRLPYPAVQAGGHPAGPPTPSAVAGGAATASSNRLWPHPLAGAQRGPSSVGPDLAWRPCLLGGDSTVIIVLLPALDQKEVPPIFPACCLTSTPSVHPAPSLQPALCLLLGLLLCRFLNYMPVPLTFMSDLVPGRPLVPGRTVWGPSGDWGLSPVLTRLPGAGRQASPTCHLTFGAACLSALTWQKIESQRGREDGNGRLACPWI